MNLELLDVLRLAWPLIVIELGLKIYSLVHLVKNGSNNLPKWAWAVIILAVSGVGPIAFLIAGKRRY